MNWTILNVSIPVYDLQKSKQFYDMLIGIMKIKNYFSNPYIKMKKVFFLVIRGLD